MSVRSSRLVNGAPIDRKHLDVARTPFRVLLGILFVGYSSISTIDGVRSDLAPALLGNPDGATIGLVVGVLVALGIFVAEILLAEASIFWYLVVLAPDAWYTYRFSDWIDTILRPHLPAEINAAFVTIPITILFSLAVAYFGERLLFGKRR